jgi:DNA-directed RNA polymerase specialized sigma24 family protein
MAAGTLNLGNPRNLLYEAIVAEIRSWADAPRKIFALAHYSGKSIEEIASQSGCDAREVLRVLECHETRLRKALRVFRIG